MGWVSAACFLQEEMPASAHHSREISFSKASNKCLCTDIWRLVVISPCSWAPSACSWDADPCRQFAHPAVSVCSLCKKQGPVKFTSRVEVCLSKLKWGLVICLNLLLLLGVNLSLMLAYIYILLQPTYKHFSSQVKWTVLAAWLVRSSIILEWLHF